MKSLRLALFQGVENILVFFNVMGVQFHPEVTQDRIQFLTRHIGEHFANKNIHAVRPIDCHLEDHKMYVASVRTWLNSVLLNQWNTSLLRD